jgi:hypothetical protein
MLKKTLDCWKNLPLRKKIIWLAAPVIAFIIILAILLLINPAPKLEFDSYNSNQGGFSVQIPGGTMEMSNSQSKFFDRQVTLYQHISDTLGYRFQVMHFDMPAGFITPIEKNGMFAQLISDFLAPVNGTVTDSVPVEIDGNQGVTIDAGWMSGEQEYIASLLVLMISNRVFVVSALGPTEDTRKNYIRDFPGSFELKI